MKLDVVITFYKNNSLLEQTLQSLYKQTWQEFNIYLVCENGCDRLNLKNAYANMRILKCDERVGPYRLVNAASQYFQSEYFAIQDADDISLNNRFAVSMYSCCKNNLDLFGCAIQNFDTNKSNNCVLKPVSNLQINAYPLGKQSLLLPHPGIIFKKSFFEQLNGYADVFCAADTEISNRFFWAGANIGSTDEVLVHRRIHANQLTRGDITGLNSVLRKDIINTLQNGMQTYPQYKNDIKYLKQFGDMEKNRQEIKLHEYTNHSF
jgi:glycosyltransferase involved in cell wall biosynthesis